MFTGRGRTYIISVIVPRQIDALYECAFGDPSLGDHVIRSADLYNAVRIIFLNSGYVPVGVIIKYEQNVIVRACGIGLDVGVIVRLPAFGRWSYKKRRYLAVRLALHHVADLAVITSYIFVLCYKCGLAVRHGAGEDSCFLRGGVGVYILKAYALRHAGVIIIFVGVISSAIMGELRDGVYLFS